MSRRRRRDSAGPARAGGEHQAGAHTPAREGSGICFKAAPRTQHLRQVTRNHLEILREAGHVSAERDRAVVYQVAPARPGGIAAALEEFSRGCDRPLAAIRRAAETGDSAQTERLF